MASLVFSVFFISGLLFQSVQFQLEEKLLLEGGCHRINPLHPGVFCLGCFFGFPGLFHFRSPFVFYLRPERIAGRVHPESADLARPFPWAFSVSGVLLHPSCLFPGGSLSFAALKYIFCRFETIGVSPKKTFNMELSFLGGEIKSGSVFVLLYLWIFPIKFPQSTELIETFPGPAGKIVCIARISIDTELS